MSYSNALCVGTSNFIYGNPTTKQKPKKEIEPYDTSMPGVSGGSYIDKKVCLLHQLGFPNVTRETFTDCKSEIEIDRRARSIILA